MNKFIDNQKMKMEQYEAKFLQAISLKNEFVDFKNSYAHLLNDDENKILQTKIDKLDEAQEQYKNYATDLTKMFNKSCELSRKFNKLLNIDDDEDDDENNSDNNSDTASNSNTEAPSEELKEPTEFTNMDEVFKNYINSNFIKTDNKHDKIKPQNIKNEFNDYIKKAKGLLNSELSTQKTNILMDELEFKMVKSQGIYYYSKIKQIDR